MAIGLLAAGLLAAPCLGAEPAEGLGFGALARPLSADLQRPPAPAPHLALELTAPRPVTSFDRLFAPPPRDPPNTFQRLLLGADKGAYGALAVGYLGTLVGAWEDETALALMGAGAVLGAAVEGITGTDKVGISISADRDR